jgi:RNA 2',3'-cyclic 3'-phosphodiesterase
MKKRLFTAIDISEQARNKISNYIQNLRGEFPDLRVGWERAEKLHLTLKFLGDCDERQTKNLETAVLNSVKIFAETENEPDIKIEISDTGVFPAKRNARILWLGLRDEKRLLSKLNQILEAECEKIGFEKEKRGFKPHLTIARLREPHKAENLAAKHLANKFKPVEFNVSEIAIYESKLLPTGSIYDKLEKFKI